METEYDDPSGSVTYDEGWEYDDVPAPPYGRSCRMIKPKVQTYRFSDNELAATARRIRDAMTLNAAKFPNSAADVTALAGEITAYEAAIQTAADARIALMGLVDAKDSLRRAIELRVRTLTGQVDSVAKGNVNLIHDAGMDASNEPAPVYMGQVVDLRLTPSENEGELLARWKPVKGARTHKVQVCLDTGAAPINWVDKLTTTKSRCTLNHDLVSGQRVWVRVRALGARDEGPWSDPAVKTVP